MGPIRTAPGRRLAALLAVLQAATVAAAPAAAEPPGADHPGAGIYRTHCARCHGENGAGTAATPAALVGDLSVGQLTAFIDESMPEDDPPAVEGDAARQVAEWIHHAFYSPVARDRIRPARVEVARLTARQHRAVLADLVASFRGPAPASDEHRGLRGEYFRGRSFDRDKGLVLERVDRRIDFDFGTQGPAAEGFEANRFAIRWRGAVLPAETGSHEFVVQSGHSVKLFVDDDATPLVDGSVRSGDTSEHRGAIFLLGGRAYPLRLEFSKANQGVDDPKHEHEAHASVRLAWRPPHGVLETVPERCLRTGDCPPTFVAATPFPPDDRVLGYERGSDVSEEWFAAATAAAVETVDHVLAHVDRLAGTAADAPDRATTLRAFAAEFAARGFRRPLDAGRRAEIVDAAFDAADSPEAGLRRALLRVLLAPEFLFHEAAGVTDPFATAARLSFGLWDSIPDRPLRDAAASAALATPAQRRSQAERMVADPRTRAKLRDFLFSWLRVDHGPEIVKDPTLHADVTPALVADLRTSLELLLDDVVWGPGGDFRRLFTAGELPVNGRLAAFLGVDLPADADFRPLPVDAGRRAGVLTHPYLLALLAYADESSPIHRGVFLARSVLGNVLRPPAEAVAPLAPDLHPDLTTRQRVALQTEAVACQACHTTINPLGFALEEFDAAGRWRTVERRAGIDRPVDASGGYRPRHGEPARFTGARELGAFIAASHDAREAFVQALFHALVKQPVRAWGPDALDTLCRGFAENGCDIRRLTVDIMVLASVPPLPDQAAGPAAVPP